MPYFNPTEIDKAAKRIAQPVELMPRLASEATAPDPGMYGTVLVFAAGMVEPAVTESRKALFGGMEVAGTSIVDELKGTANLYRAVQREAEARVAALQAIIDEIWDD